MPNPLPITVISAGAGSGKTYTLTERMVEMLAKGVRPSAILATTFTKKAAAELQERVRAKLLENGQTEAATELGSALIGTVHSIGVQLLQRFAFEAGVSPLVEVIAEGDEQRLFNESLAQILSAERTETMNRLSEKLGLTKKGFGAEPFDWRSIIRNITDVARANNFSKEVLENSKIRSWTSFAELLPPPENTDTLTWNNRLLHALQHSAAALEANEADTTKVTKDAIIQIRQMEHTLRVRGELHWHEWVKIAKISPGAKSRDLLETLRELALRHEAHRDFQNELKQFIELVFDIAIDALSEYEAYKTKRGLIDYTDMETSVRRLLRIPSVRNTLRSELDLLLVDEFQDTSPIQLDIFLQLSRIARHSIWVGDPKQSIYGFRGAEPALMQAIIDATGGIQPQNVLRDSWRSRPDIVEACNAIFTKAFDAMPPEQIVLQPAFSIEKEKAFWAQHDPDPLDPHYALQHWHFVNIEDNNKAPGRPWLEDCIARQVKVLLERRTPVFTDKKRNAVRPVQPADIAILCRNNSHCEQMAEALHRAGLKAGIARAGLLHTPEIRLALAYMKRLVNPNDRLSAAEIRIIGGEHTLEQLLRQLAEAPPDLKWSLLEIPMPGTDLHIRSAAEALDLLLAETDLRRKVCALGNAVQRLDNIEVLRRYAREYESACNRLHSAATIGGFLLWLNQLAEQRRDMQGSGESRDTIHVLTYHKSKGLEYPVCICCNLDQSLKEKVWGINLIPEGPPDLEDILGGRWLRYWVNPYSDQLKGSLLDDRLRNSEAFMEAGAQALAEEARLLYVGLTRARDYLIFPGTVKPMNWLNRVFSRNEAAPTLDPDSDETPFYTPDGRCLRIQTEKIFQPKQIPAAQDEEAPFVYFSPFSGKKSYFPEKINPLQEAPPGGKTYAVAGINSVLPALEVAPEHWERVQAALRSLLLAQATSLSAAKTQWTLRQLEGALTPEALWQQADAGRRWIAQSLQAQQLLPQHPLLLSRQQRLLDISLDLLVIDTQGQLHVLYLLKNTAQKGGIKQAATAVASWLGWAETGLRTWYPTPSIRLYALDLVSGQVAIIA